MSRVLMIGYGPLPGPGLAVYGAAGLRTHQMLQGALLGGHTVDLHVLPLPGTETGEVEGSGTIPERGPHGAYVRFASHGGELAIRTLREKLADGHPDAIVAVGSYPAYVASMLPSTAPLWCDFGRCWMTERQAQASAEEDDRSLLTALNIERTALRRLDRFSAVSRPHLHSMEGAMAAAGRLNRRTFRYFFGSRVPHAGFNWPSGSLPDGERVLRGPVVPEDAFVLLWSGGFDPACDIATFVAAMDELLARGPSVRVVVTGGAVRGVEARAYRQFQRAVDDSPHRDRYHLLGWVASEKLGAIYREADLGLRVDGANHDSVMRGGCRLIGMASEGLPCVATIACEASEWFEDGDALFGASIADPGSIVEAVEPLIGCKDALRAAGSRARRIVEEDFSIERTTRALKEWLDNPTSAPDNAEKIRMVGTPDANLLQIALNPIEEQFLQAESPRPATASEPAGDARGPAQWWGGLVEKVLGRKG